MSSIESSGYAPETVSEVKDTKPKNKLDQIISKMTSKIMGPKKSKTIPESGEFKAKGHSDEHNDSAEFINSTTTYETIAIVPEHDKKYVYFFDEGNKGMINLLGGKGAHLAEMTSLGLPIPQGFTITTEAGRVYSQENKLPKEIIDQIEQELSRLEHLTNKEFGKSDPLLVSVRSGAKISIPGMMDTILNIGLNDETAAALIAQTKNPRFVFDSYKRTIKMFADVVYGIDPEEMEEYVKNDSGYHRYERNMVAANYLREIDPKTFRKMVLSNALKSLDEEKESIVKYMTRIKRQKCILEYRDLVREISRLDKTIPKIAEYNGVPEMFARKNSEKGDLFSQKLFDFLEKYNDEYENPIKGKKRKLMSTDICSVIEHETINQAHKIMADNPWCEIRLMESYIENHSEKAFPQDAREQLYTAIESVFESWNNVRAKEYRKLNNISDSLGTAVNIQSMVFGNLNDNSGTGVCFSRNPITGEKELYGEFLASAQGEDVVAGIRTPEPIAQLATKNPKIYSELKGYIDILENHNKDMQDIEFTVQDGRLYLLQTRNGKRSAGSTVRIARDMVLEGLISKNEAIMRINTSDINRLFDERLDPMEKYFVVGNGTPASVGIVSGAIALTSEKAEEYMKQNIDCILVRRETSPEDIKGINASKGIWTKIGGSTSHAALVARAMNKCCITGCLDMNIKDGKVYIKDKTGNTTTYDEGEEITLNGYTGEIIDGTVKILKDKNNPYLDEIISWSKGLLSKDLQVSADTPQEMVGLRQEGFKHIGLTRTDHHFFIGDSLTKTRNYIASNKKNRKEALDTLRYEQERFYSALFEVADDMSIRIQLLATSPEKFLPSEIEYKIMQKNKDQSATYKRLKSIKKSMANSKTKYDNSLMHEIYSMQIGAISDAIKDISPRNLNLEILIPSIVPAEYRRDISEVIKNTLTEELEAGTVKINDRPEKIYISNEGTTPYADLKQCPEMADAYEIIVTKQKNLPKVTIEMAKYNIIKGEDEKRRGS